LPVTPDELRRARCVAQGLTGAETTPAAAVRRLLAVQAQDLRAARLALRARCPELTIGEIDAAFADGSLVVSWLMRGTLHLVHRDDHAALHALTTPAVVARNQRRLGQEGVPPADADRAVAIIEQAVADTPLSRDELARRVAAAGVRSEGQAMPHLLMLASLRGRIVMTVHDGRPAYVRNTLPVKDELALTELVRRYLRGHAPATVADIAAWSGLGVRDVRAAVQTLEPELRRDGDLLDRPGRDSVPDQVPVRLLPAFDPYLLGWRDRGFAVPDSQLRRVHPGGGMLRAVATVDGAAVGTWTLRRGPRPVVRIEPFGPLPARARAALDREADDVVRFESST
jgi:hypothetical protein